MKLDDALAKLDSFLALPEGWSGCSESVPATRTAVQRAAFLIREIAKLCNAAPYAVAPLDDGGVQVDWRTPDRDIQIDVDPYDEFTAGFDVLVVTRTYMDVRGLNVSQVGKLLRDLLK